MGGEDSHLEADYEDRQNGGIDVDEDEDEEDYERDPEVEERRAIFEEVMARNPGMAFTGASVSDYIYHGGDLESAGEEMPDLSEY